jgi:hypothetical protein
MERTLRLYAPPPTALKAFRYRYCRRPCLPSQKHPIKGCYQKSTHDPLDRGAVLQDQNQPMALTPVRDCDNNRIMNERSHSPITDVLKDAIVKSDIPYKTLERETGVKRSSIQRFIDGRQSLRLDMADRLAEYFGLSVVSNPRPKRPRSYP